MLFSVRTSRRMDKGVCRYGVRDRERVFIPVSEHLPDIKPVGCHQVKKASSYSFHESRPFEWQGVVGRGRDRSQPTTSLFFCSHFNLRPWPEC